MHNTLHKQLFLFFVFLLVSIPVAVLLSSLKGIPVEIRYLIICILFFSLLISGVRWVQGFCRSYSQVEQALQDLNEGRAFRENGSAANLLFGSLLASLDKASKRMKQQQQELEEERVNRLRSVIDGQDQERQRLSRELHDGMGQSLIAVKLQLESAGDLSHSQMRASVDVAKGMLDQTIDEVRRVTNALLPAALNEFGLITALRTRCEEMANAAGLKVAFENHGSVDRLDNKSKTYLYRIAQEAITNTIKHARASQMDIKLNRSGQEVTLQISDNGKGFIFDPVSFAHRNGIQNMRERVALLNGSFDIKSRPNAGTTLKVTIPYKTGNGKHSHPTGR